MKESTKEWLGIKTADLMMYAGFLFLIPVYYSKSLILDIALFVPGLVLCFLSCLYGMKPHPDLDRVTNFIKLIAYPVSTLLFMYLWYSILEI